MGQNCSSKCSAETDGDVDLKKANKDKADRSLSPLKRVMKQCRRDAKTVNENAAPSVDATRNQGTQKPNEHPPLNQHTADRSLSPLKRVMNQCKRDASLKVAMGSQRATVFDRPAARSRSRQPFQQVLRPPQTGHDPAATLLGTVMTEVTHGAPPGNWSEAGSDTNKVFLACSKYGVPPGQLGFDWGHVAAKAEADHVAAKSKLEHVVSSETRSGNKRTSDGCKLDASCDIYSDLENERSKIPRKSFLGGA